MDLLYRQNDGAGLDDEDISDFDNVKAEDVKGLIMQGAFNNETSLHKTMLLVDPYDTYLSHFEGDPEFSYVILDARFLIFSTV